MSSLFIFAITSVVLALLLQSTLRFGDQHAADRPLRGTGHWVDRLDQWYEEETRKSLSGGGRKAAGYLIGWIICGAIGYAQTWWIGLILGLIGGMLLADALYNLKR
jgi:hypothetical protein